MTTKTIENLQTRLFDLQRVIITKRNELGAVLADGGDTKPLMGELAQLEAEAKALPAAIQFSERKAAEFAAAKAIEDAKAQEWARGELTKAEGKAAKALAELGKQLDQIQAMRLRLPAMTTTPLMTARFVEIAQAELKRIGSMYPELVGLPPRRSAKEEKRIELQSAVDRAAARLQGLEAVKADRNNPHSYSVKDDMLEEAKSALAKAKKALSEL